MVKVLIACDEHIYVYEGDYYGRDFAHVLIERYLNVFSEVRFVSRVKIVDSLDVDRYKRIVDSRVEIYPIPFFQGPLQYIKKWNKIRRQIKNVTDGCTVAILRLPSPTGFAVLAKIKGKGMKYGVEVVANPIEIVKGTKKLLFKISFKFVHSQLKRACKNADCASYVTKKVLQEIYPVSNRCKFQTNYSSIELSKEFYFSNRVAITSGREVIISHVSNPINTTNKGHETVIRVIKHLSDMGYKNITVKFAGDGLYVNRFKALANNLGVADKVFFVGLLDKDKLREFLLGSDIMLFPSISEGLPRVVIEAMATGLPCLASPVGGIPELLSSDMLFSPKDVDGYAGKILEIIKNPDIYFKLSMQNYENSLEYIDKRLDIKRSEFYNKLKNNI